MTRTRKHINRKGRIGIALNTTMPKVFGDIFDEIMPSTAKPKTESLRHDDRGISTKGGKRNR